MTEDLEGRLRTKLPPTPLPSAPPTLHLRLRAIASTQPDAAPQQARSARLRLLLGVAAVIAVGAGALIIAGRSAPPMPIAVDGLPVITVSEALAAHAAGTLPGSRAAIKGYWSNREVGHSCNPGTAPIGDLEIRCHDGEYGITELDEPIWNVNLQSGVVDYEARGPHLTPYFDDGLQGLDALFELPYANGQWFPPVPILVVGHFDDARAALCNPERRQLCLDRLVLERIVRFDAASMPTPGVTPTPTPFPSPWPSALFDATACAGDVPYSFVGWTTTGELELPFDRAGHVFAAVTRDAIKLTEGGWHPDPNGSGHKYQLWGRRICISEEWAGGGMTFGSVPSSTYVLWDDGLKTPGSDPIRPPGSS